LTLLGVEHGYLEVQPHAPEERRQDRDVILLLHGTGGNKFEWSFPDWRGYNYDHENDPPNRHDDNNLTPPLNVLPQFSLSDKKDVRCWTSILTALGHTVIFYSQDGPDDFIDVAYDQFVDLIVPFIRDDVLTGALAGKRVTIIAHSRGGILTRLYLAENPADGSQWIQRVVTLCSPHGATNAPRAKRRLRDAIEQRFLGSVPTVARLLFPFLNSFPLIGFDVEPTDAQAQLLPGDALFDQLSQPTDTPTIAFHTFGGSSVTLTRVYVWWWSPTSWIPRWDFPNPIPQFDWTLLPVEILPVSPMVDRLGNDMVFAEQREGQGDICVTIESAQLPGVPHQTLPINHAEAFFDETLFARVTDTLGTPLGNTVAEECTSGWIGNVRTLELHDPSRQRRNCQLDEIVFRWPFSKPEDAFDAGYDGCAYCMPEHHHPEPD
jgi:pimeloyl-ACP methyl ester carboxylesterase